jgi:roadblock/LC7 domain-containing protein
MSKLDDLLKIDGVVAAGEWAADGELVDYKAKRWICRLRWLQ